MNRDWIELFNHQLHRRLPIVRHEEGNNMVLIKINKAPEFVLGSDFFEKLQVLSTWHRDYMPITHVAGKTKAQVWEVMKNKASPNFAQVNARRAVDHSEKAKEGSKPVIDKVPDEILINITQNLQHHDRITLKLVSKRLNGITSDPRVVEVGPPAPSTKSDVVAALARAESQYSLLAHPFDAKVCHDCGRVRTREHFFDEEWIKDGRARLCDFCGVKRCKYLGLNKTWLFRGEMHFICLYCRKIHPMRDLYKGRRNNARIHRVCGPGMWEWEWCGSCVKAISRDYAGLFGTLAKRPNHERQYKRDLMRHGDRFHMMPNPLGINRDYQDHWDFFLPELRTLPRSNLVCFWPQI